MVGRGDRRRSQKQIRAPLVDSMLEGIDFIDICLLTVFDPG
jgi:hypothetical protein